MMGRGRRREEEERKGGKDRSSNKYDSDEVDGLAKRATKGEVDCTLYKDKALVGERGRCGRGPGWWAGRSRCLDSGGGGWGAVGSSTGGIEGSLRVVRCQRIAGRGLGVCSFRRSSFAKATSIIRYNATGSRRALVVRTSHIVSFGGDPIGGLQYGLSKLLVEKKFGV
ncbi:unnamed protein product [Calypogeia fissa]